MLLAFSANPHPLSYCIQRRATRAAAPASGEGGSKLCCTSGPDIVLRYVERIQERQTPPLCLTPMPTSFFLLPVNMLALSSCLPPLPIHFASPPSFMCLHLYQPSFTLCLHNPPSLAPLLFLSSNRKNVNMASHVYRLSLTPSIVSQASIDYTNHCPLCSCELSDSDAKA